jgi:transcriptional regulator with XRE-family HTH domain
MTENSQNPVKTKALHRRTYIREWRKFRKMTLEQLAERISDGMGASALSMLERGKRRYTQESLENIATALVTTPTALLGRRPNDAEDIWLLWENATSDQRAQIAEIAKTITKSRQN